MINFSKIANWHTNTLYSLLIIKVSVPVEAFSALARLGGDRSGFTFVCVTTLYLVTLYIFSLPVFLSHHHLLHGFIYFIVLPKLFVFTTLLLFPYVLSWSDIYRLTNVYLLKHRNRCISGKNKWIRTDLGLDAFGSILARVGLLKTHLSFSSFNFSTLQIDFFAGMMDIFPNDGWIRRESAALDLKLFLMHLCFIKLRCEFASILG